MNQQNLYSEYKVSDSDNLQQNRIDFLSNEFPVAISFNGISHVVMMATPMDLEDFVIGFSFTEGIISSIDDVFDIEISKNDHGIDVEVEIAQEPFQKLKHLKRNLSGKTGCGICGIESLEYFTNRLKLNYPKKKNFLITTKHITASLDAFLWFTTVPASKGTQNCAWIVPDITLCPDGLGGVSGDTEFALLAC